MSRLVIFKYRLECIFKKGKFFRRILLIGLILNISVGCERSAIELTDEPFIPSPVPISSDSASMPIPMTIDAPDPVVQALVLQAKKYLVEKLGLNLDEISLFNIQAVEWPDASLGCPREGVMYAQVITPGYQIQFQAKGEVFTFHTDTGNQVILCTASRPSEIFIPP